MFGHSVLFWGKVMLIDELAEIMDTLLMSLDALVRFIDTLVMLTDVLVRFIDALVMFTDALVRFIEALVTFWVKFAPFVPLNIGKVGTWLLRRPTLRFILTEGTVPERNALV